MTENEKDAWILSQAKILSDWKQEDFYKSICGTKKVIDMPERSEITEFCKKVRNGDISIEYETHYVEVEALLKRGGFEKEPWEVKEYILEEIYENGYYDYFGVCDPMMDLACADKERCFFVEYDLDWKKGGILITWNSLILKI